MAFVELENGFSEDGRQEIVSGLDLEEGITQIFGQLNNLLFVVAVEVTDGGVGCDGDGWILLFVYFKWIGFV